MQGSMGRLERLAPLTGAVFAVALGFLIFADGDTPDADAKIGKVVSFYTKHHDREMVFALIGAIAVVFLVWFAGVVFTVLTRQDGAGRLASTAFAGAVIAGVGGGLFSLFQFTLADTINDITPAGSQVLNALNGDGFVVLAAGVAIYQLAFGICVLRHGGLPRWLGWVSLVIGIVAVTPLGFFAFMAFLIWNLIASAVIYGSWAQPAAAPPAAASPAP